MATIRNNRLNNMGGYMKDFGWGEHPSIDEAREDNQKTDEEVLTYLAGTN